MTPRKANKRSPLSPKAKLFSVTALARGLVILRTLIEARDCKEAEERTSRVLNQQGIERSEVKLTIRPASPEDVFSVHPLKRYSSREDGHRKGKRRP
jgi:hypothetical protein